MSAGAYTKETGDADWREDIARAKAGDAEAKGRLLLRNEGLIHMVLRRFRSYGADMEELYQVGAIGLLRAVDRFDLSTDYAFSTYAVPMIIGEIRRFLRDDGMLHVSRGLKEQAHRIAAFREEWAKGHAAEPTIAELVQGTGIPREQLLMAMEASAAVDSIDRPVRNHEAAMKGETMTLGDSITDETRMEAGILQRMDLSAALQALSGEDRMLIRMRYLEGRTQGQVAQTLGINQVAVSRREKKILLRMRERMQNG